MRMATIRTEAGTVAARVEADHFVELDARDVGDLLMRDNWREQASSSGGAQHARDAVRVAPVVPNPRKILCVGLNYRSHVTEMGRDLPDYPTLFAKFADALIGPTDDIMLAPESGSVDWEAELAVVIGKSVRRASADSAAEAIAGFTVMNDVTMRDWQFRTREWLQGKTFEGTTPLGPVLVTPDELPGGLAPRLAISASVNGEVVQKADTSDLVFSAVDLVRYISTIVTLRPGDVIATGTPGGVGHARIPQRYLRPGDVLVTEIEHVGRLENTARLG
jgi:acylpyruvate hydrolase